MSLIDSLDDETLWNSFLEIKENSINISQKELDKYKVFIENKKYKKISKKIIENNYEFSIPRKVLLGKMGKAKKRAVYIYNEEENYILKFLTYLLYKYDSTFSPNLYSFRKDSGVRKAVFNIIRKTKNKRMCAYKVDIQNYFNSIPVEELLKELRETLEDEKLYSLIEKLLLNPRVNFNGQIICEEKGIMAGVPISAFLANFYLKELDRYFYENNILYARYADDIIVFGKSTQTVEGYRKIIISFLEQKGLEINKEKEFFYNFGEKFDFLGFSFENGTIDINENSFKKIKGKIRRTARGFRRWMIKKSASPEVTLKAMNRKFNRKFFGKTEDDLTWKYWFFPLINTDTTLKKVDQYMQEQQRYLVTGVHNKRNFEKVPYEFLKKCNYRSLINEYYKTKI